MKTVKSVYEKATKELEAIAAKNKKIADGLITAAETQEAQARRDRKAAQGYQGNVDEAQTAIDNFRGLFGIK